MNSQEGIALNIVFIGLASYYSDGMTYQDNELCRQTLADGHRVTYISNPEKYVGGHLVDTGAEDVILPDGLHLIRLPYCKVGPDVITKKFRKFKGLYSILEQEQPDIIFCHDHHYWSLLDVIRYKKAHPAVKLYADTHVAHNNSGTNWVSLHILHGLYYKWLTKKLLPHLDAYFYISDECRQFSHEVYGIPNERMEFYPLGGNLPRDEDYAAARRKRREELGLSDGARLYLHSGKLDPLKRTEELLRAFSAVEDPHAMLAVIGSIPEEQKPVLLPLMEADKRVKYLGWKSGAELQEYLCACDLYCQPGSQSATMQNAMCCRCPVMLYPHPSHKDYDWGSILWVETQADMEDSFRALAADPGQLAPMKQRSQACAEALLDYRKLAARLYR